MKQRQLALTLVCLGLCSGASAYNLKSPGRDIEVNIEDMTYSLTYKGVPLISEGKLGYSSADCTSMRLVGEDKHRSVWRPVWGKRREVKDEYNEMKLLCGKDTVTFRAYDDGIAFRYSLGTAHSNVHENTSFNFADDFTAWFYNGERHNIGPEKLTDSEGERLPVMTIESPHAFMAVHEADLRGGEPLKLVSSKGTKEFSVMNRDSDLPEGFKSGWRVVMCSDKIGDLVDSHIIELLNPEPSGDFSWVRPGVCLWDWRINGAEYDGFSYGMDYPSWVRMVDFAAEQGFPHLVLDANWYGPEFDKQSDPLKGDKANDVHRLIGYAKEKGVGIWLYLNDVAGRSYPIEQTLKQYGEWGAAGVKYGFMSGSPAEKNAKTQQITKLCADNKLLVDYHDYPVHPFGQSRTWPNAVTREYCKAQLDGHDIFYPKTFVTSVFVNMLAGPIDMNNGMMDLRQGKTTRVDNNQEVPSTVASEGARTLITYSGATVIPDIPEYYHRYPSILRFLSAQKQPWSDSRTLDGKIGEYIVMMRQSNDGAYLVGAATNENSRNLTIPLDFLPKGEYMAEITTDGDDANYLTNRETVKVENTTVTSKSKLNVRLAPGGGACILIRKK